VVTRARHGRSAFGCLLFLAFLGAIGYIGFQVGSVYFRYYQFRDADRQEALFAEQTSDDTIITRLRDEADSLGLPPEAQHIHVRRSKHLVQIWTEYTDSVVLPGLVHEIDFVPHAERRF
jgi:hypothetical protein